MHLMKPSEQQKHQKKNCFFFKLFFLHSSQFAKKKKVEIRTSSTKLITWNFIENRKLISHLQPLAGLKKKTCSNKCNNKETYFITLVATRNIK